MRKHVREPQSPSAALPIRAEAVAIALRKHLLKI